MLQLAKFALGLDWTPEVPIHTLGGVLVPDRFLLGPVEVVDGALGAETS